MARNYEYDVKPTTTVLELKKRFCQDTNSEEDLHTLCLIFDGEELEEDKKTLSDYSIPDECQLNVFYHGGVFKNQRAFLGSRLVDISNNSAANPLSWSQTAPPWRKSTRGLCLEGTCDNQRCIAYKHCVIMRIGFKRFDILNDSDESTTVCPMCAQYVDPTKIAFNNCWWRYEGVKQSESGTGNAPVRCSGKWQEVGDVYRRFDEGRAGIVIWRRLIVEAAKNKQT